jgi:hypothetical protein
MMHPYEYGAALTSGALVGYAELFIRNKRLPWLGNIVKRGSPASDIGMSLVFCLMYAAVTTIYLFDAGDEKQYFIAAGAAIQTLANVIR